MAVYGSICKCIISFGILLPVFHIFFNCNIQGNKLCNIKQTNTDTNIVIIFVLII